MDRIESLGLGWGLLTKPSYPHAAVGPLLVAMGKKNASFAQVEINFFVNFLFNNSTINLACVLARF
jgi:hypothetical protein